MTTVFFPHGSLKSQVIITILFGTIAQIAESKSVALGNREAEPEDQRGGQNAHERPPQAAAAGHLSTN